MKSLILYFLALPISLHSLAQYGQLNPTSVQIPNVNGINNVPTPASGMVIYNTQDQIIPEK